MADIEQAKLPTGAGIMEKDELESILEQPIIARIATTGKDLQPHAVPVWFWWDGTYMYTETGWDFRNARQWKDTKHAITPIG